MSQKLLFCTDTDSGTISVFEAAKAAADELIERIPVGNGPRGPVKFTGAGRGFVANHAGDSLSEIDAYSMRETGRIKVGLAPIGVAIIPGDRYLLTSNAGDNTISVVDIDARKETHRLATGREPRHMDVLPDGSAAYAAISGSDCVAKIDTTALVKDDPDAIPRTVREVKRIHLGAGTMPYSVAISPCGRYALAANNQTPYVSLLDLTEDAVLHQVDVGGKGARGSVFSPDSAAVFVTLEDSSEIVAIDVREGAVTNRFEAGPGPRGILLDPEDSTLYASAFTRTAKPAARGMRPNSVSVLRLGAGLQAQGLAKARPELSDVAVGAGPCSVSMFVRS